MATLTNNYHLTKPDITDAVSIAVINDNMDTIDTQVKAISTQVETIDSQVGTIDTQVKAIDTQVKAIDSQVDVIDTSLTGKLDKLTYEWNKQVAFGSTGKLLLYKGRCYDTNITIDIDTTTATTYHATFVVATQNSRIMEMTVYGDPTNTVGNSLYVVPCTGQTSAETETIEIYMSPQSWSKNMIRIRAVAPRTAPTNVCENVSSIPSTATSTYASGAIVNALDSKLSTHGGTMSGNLTVGSAKVQTNGYVTATWLQTTADIHLGSAPPNYPVLSSEGLIYSRTAAEMKSDLGIDAMLPLAGGAMTGNLTVGSASIGTNGYIQGTWLQTTASIHLGSAPSNYPVLNEGWIYSRTKAEMKSDLGIDDKLNQSGGTLTGALVAQTNTDYATAQVRNVIISTSDPSGGSSGDIWIKYS